MVLRHIADLVPRRTVCSCPATPQSGYEATYGSGARKNPEVTCGEMSEEERQKELSRVGARLHDDCYDNKNPASCHQYADYLQGVEREPSKAAEVFRMACREMGFSESCFALGNLYLRGSGVEKDWRKAADLYEHACANGSMGACNNAGLVWQSAYEDRPPNYKQAAMYFKKACKGGLKNGCFNLSGMYLEGRGAVAKDMPKALKYSIKSCDLGHAWGCANASRMYRLGDGVKMDRKKAEKYKERAKELQQTHSVTMP